MERLSGDYDNAFTVTKGGLFAGGGGHVSFVRVRVPLSEVKVIKMTGDILVID